MDLHVENVWRFTCDVWDKIPPDFSVVRSGYLYVLLAYCKESNVSPVKEEQAQQSQVVYAKNNLNSKKALLKFKDYLFALLLGVFMKALLEHFLKN